MTHKRLQSQTNGNIANAIEEAGKKLGQIPSVDTDMSTMLKMIETWAGSRQEALKWYRTHSIGALEGLTAQELVKQGRSRELIKYLVHMADGGYA